MFSLRNKSVLDLGFSEKILQMIDAEDITVLDNDPALIKIANNQGYKTICVNLNDEIALKPLNRYDAIFMFDILEHLVDPEIMLNQISKKQRKGDLIFITVPNSLNIINRFYYLFGNSLDITDMNHLTKKIFSDHLHVVTFKKIKKLFSKYRYRLKVINRYYPSKISRHKKNFFYVAVYKIINFFRINRLFPEFFSFGYFIVGEKR